MFASSSLFSTLDILLYLISPTVGCAVVIECDSAKIPGSLVGLVGLRGTQFHNRLLEIFKKTVKV